MNSLPTDDSTVSPQPQGFSVGVTKESEPMTVTPEASGLREIGQDMELPEEVSSAGVKVQPTAVSVPTPVSQLGVQPAGGIAPAQGQSNLPLTDDEIAKGLTQSITDSWRWLAEWCKMRLKKLRLAS